MSNEALTWAKWVSHQLSKRATHLENQAAESGLKKPNNPYSGTPLHLLMVLADYANEDWQCWPSQSTLVDDLGGITERTIRRGLRLLEQLGAVTTERLVNQTGARIGTTYQLHVETLHELVDSNRAMGIETPQPRLGRSRKATQMARSNPMNVSPDNLSGGAENPMSVSPDILSGGKPTGQKRPSLADKNDNSASEYIKEHARINPHHQSSDVQPFATISTTDDDEVQNRSYRDVNIDQLFRDVPGLAGYTPDPGLVEAVVDIVLGRARGRITQPTAYVRQSLISDLYGLVGAAMEIRRHHEVGRVVPLSLATPANSEVPGPDVVGMTDPDEVPVVEDLPDGAIPCTNMDHLRSYDMSSRMLAHCNHCRVEQLGADASQSPHYPHVANATQEQISALSARLQRWVLQWHPHDAGAGHFEVAR